MIFKSKYQRVLKEEYKSLRNKLNLAEKANKGLADDLKISQNEVTKLSALLNTLRDDKEKVIRKHNDLLNRKDKLREQVTELKKEATNLKEELKLVKEEKSAVEKEYADFKKDKWLINKIPSGRIPNKQRIGVKSGAKTSRIIKKVKENV